MKHFWKIVLSLALFGLLAACTSPPEQPADTEPDVAEVEPTEEVEVVEAEPTATEVVEPTDEPEEEVVEEVEEADEAEVMEEEEPTMAVDGPQHTAALTVADASVERAYDHAKGASEPVVTIIEYGDFQ